MRMLAILIAALGFASPAVALAAAKEPPKPTETSGPIGAGAPPVRWGGSVELKGHDAWLWFGGTGGVSPSGALRTWLYKGGAWTEPALGDDAQKKRHAESEALAGDARALYVAAANRYYLSELPEERDAKLDAAATALAAKVAAGAWTDGWPKDAAAKAKAALEALAAPLSGALDAKAVGAARDAWQACVRLAWANDAQPAPRGYASLAYDESTGTAVLFGGEGEHGTYGDTWLYNAKAGTWTAARPALGPSPRCGAGIAARDGKIYLCGGFDPYGSMSYCAGLWRRLPFDVWAFDIKAQTWSLLLPPPEADPKAKPQSTVMQPPVKLALSPDGSKLSWTADVLSYGKKVKELAGSLDLPGSDADEAKCGVPPDTVAVRGQGFDPAWYENVPPADPAAWEAALKALPKNLWTDVAPPVRHVNRDWGTTVLDPDRDQLLHWAGGHSSHCGTDVAHFSLSTGRWHILYTPELPFESCYSNDGAPVPTFSGSPWGPHSYLSYAYDPKSKRMIWAGRHGAYAKTNPCGLFTYDPGAYAWSAPQWKIEGGWFDIERHKTCMVPTPHGIAVWGDKVGGSGVQTGLWLADMDAHLFRPLAATDKNDRSTLPNTAFGDRHGITYDSKRDRVLIFHFGIKDKQKIWSCDLKTKQVSVLEPKNSGTFPDDVSLGREATYLPDDDAVIVCTSGKPQRTLLYDCAGDAWLELPEPCAKGEKGRGTAGYGVSTGIEWDPKRKLLWLVQTDGHVFAMPFDKTTAKLAAPAAATAPAK